MSPPTTTFNTEPVVNNKQTRHFNSLTNIFGVSVKSSAGFTLFESVVALSMVTIIAGISFSGLTSYADYFALRDSIRSLEATARTAQDFAISIQDVNNSNSFLGKFGIKVDSAIPTEIIMYGDSQSDQGEVGYNIYDGVTECVDSECIERTILGRGVHISDICTVGINDVETCGRGRVDVVFIRPRTDAHVYIDSVEDETIKELRIMLSSKSEREISVTIGATGFITS